jgi:small subunit ribosomal protein S6e
LQSLKKRKTLAQKETIAEYNTLVAKRKGEKKVAQTAAKAAKK